MICQGCGIEKDELAKEIYPFSEVDGICDKPISPFFQLDCEDYGTKGPFKSVTVCHQCFHKLQPDMWISRRCWESLNPVVTFSELENC